MNKEIYYLLTLAHNINRMANYLGDEPPCVWYSEGGKRFLSMFEGHSIHEIPPSVDLTELEERKG